MKFRKKPVVIDAVHIQTIQDAEQAVGICTGGIECPKHGPEGSHPHVHDLEGDHTWTPGDWLITGVKGERYFCKPDIFALTYEPESAVGEAPPAGETPEPKKRCPMCNGTGEDAEGDPISGWYRVPCSVCHGTGDAPETER